MTIARAAFLVAVPPDDTVNLAFDSRGNLYVDEVATGRRVRKLTIE